MKKLISILFIVVSLSIMPDTVQSNDRLKACLNANCGLAGNAICSITWWPNADGTITWYYCEMIVVVGKRPPQKV